MYYLRRHLSKEFRYKDGNIGTNTRPVELKMLYIAKATGLSYKQVRTRIDKLVQDGVLLRYKASYGPTRHGDFYRFNTGK